MWNAIQDAAGNFANRASKLAVEVLDAGPPDKLVSNCFFDSKGQSKCCLEESWE